MGVFVRRWTRSKVPSSTRAGTGMPVHSSRGRSRVLTYRGRRGRRGGRYGSARTGSWMAWVLPKTAVPAWAGLRSTPQITVPAFLACAGGDALRGEPAAQVGDGPSLPPSAGSDR